MTAFPSNTRKYEQGIRYQVRLDRILYCKCGVELLPDDWWTAEDVLSAPLPVEYDKVSTFYTYCRICEDKIFYAKKHHKK